MNGLLLSFRESRFSEFLRRWRCRVLLWRATRGDIHAAAAVAVSGSAIRGTFSGKVCRHSLFARECLASLEGPPEAWNLAKIVIDHCCHIFTTLDSHRPELGLLDWVVQALFRRTLITGEAFRSLLAPGPGS